jgi:hypothetical protein
MSKDKEEDNKIKLTLRQIGDPTHDDELEYEVIDTSCARFACKEIFDRDKAIELCDEHEVTIVYKEDDQKISGFSN